MKKGSKKYSIQELLRAESIAKCKGKLICYGKILKGNLSSGKIFSKICTF